MSKVLQVHTIEMPQRYIKIRVSASLTAAACICHDYKTVKISPPGAIFSGKSMQYLFGTLTLGIYWDLNILS